MIGRPYPGPVYGLATEAAAGYGAPRLPGSVPPQGLLPQAGFHAAPPYLQPQPMLQQQPMQTAVAVGGQPILPPQAGPPVPSRAVSTTYGRLPINGLSTAGAPGTVSAAAGMVPVCHQSTPALGPPPLQSGPPPLAIATSCAPPVNGMCQGGLASLRQQIRCENCGATCDANARYCSMCGHALPATARMPPQAKLASPPVDRLGSDQCACGRVLGRAEDMCKVCGRERLDTGGGVRRGTTPSEQFPPSQAFNGTMQPPVIAPGGTPSYVPLPAPQMPTAGGSAVAQAPLRPPSYVPPPHHLNSCARSHVAPVPTSLEARARPGPCLSYVAPPIPPPLAAPAPRRGAQGRQIGSHVPAPCSKVAPHTPSNGHHVDAVNNALCWVPPPVTALEADLSQPLPMGVPVWSPPSQRQQAVADIPCRTASTGLSALHTVDALSKTAIGPLANALPAAAPHAANMVLPQESSCAIKPLLLDTGGDAGAGCCKSSQKPYEPPYCPNRVPTVDGVEHLEPKVVHNLLKSKSCLLIDLRSEDRSAGLIDGSINVPAIAKVPFYSRIDELVREWADQRLVVFTCQYSAHRAPQCANWYRAKAAPSQGVAILSGGFRGWEAEGLPVSSAAVGSAAQAADKLALSLGTHFTQQRVSLQ
mmetsp:Transcript_9295/g.16756  ORF Transcript_9295/g.16756 Transcript_9295/m.16756 type:complete len:645 (+) Transcript_9295:118-2052(+)